MSSISSNCSLDLLSRQDEPDLVSVFRYSTQVFTPRGRRRVKILTRISETSFTTQLWDMEPQNKLSWTELLQNGNIKIWYTILGPIHKLVCYELILLMQFDSFEGLTPGPLCHCSLLGQNNGESPVIGLAFFVSWPSTELGLVIVTCLYNYMSNVFKPVF